PIGSIRIDTITGFDLYVKLRPGEPQVLYAKRDVPFTEDALARLRRSNVKTLYVSTNQETQYYAYLEKNLGAVLQDPQLDTKHKSQVLYSTAQGLVESLLANPLMEGGVGRS